jgi:peptide/nickel transport system substrate-binding protein
MPNKKKEKKVKRRQFWVGLGLSFLMVAVTVPSLLLTSCTSKTTTSTSAVTTTTTAAANTPVYGATMTMLNDLGSEDPPSWDIGTSENGGVTSVYINPYLEPFFNGDIDTYGPRGNGAFSFLFPQYLPTQFLHGNIAQSWSFQQSPLSLTITLKQGIMWTGNANIPMAARELTAADCVFAEIRQFQAPSMAAYFTWIQDCVVVDNYTFKYDFASYNSQWQFFLLYGGGLAFPFAPESANATGNGGSANWKNAVGTGPFMLTDFVDGASCTFTKNPNYWGKTTINGKVYNTPFIDKLVYLIIPDPSTQLAAIQTGKVDLYTQESLTNSSTLKQQSPDLIQKKWPADNIDVMRMNRLKSGPLQNLQVRQALTEATDFATIAQNVYGGGDIFTWPVPSSSPSYTPLNQQSAAIQALYSFNTTEAKQMLTAAGYPNGFTITITVDSAIARQADEATIIAANWAKIGVTVQIVTMNGTAESAARDNLTYTGLITFGLSIADPTMTVSYYQNSNMSAIYAKGEPLDLLATSIMQEQDPAKQQSEITAFCPQALLDCGILAMPNADVVNCYWPWLKNYYGEVEAAYHSQIPMVAELWIDQGLKTSLGYH